MTTWLDKIKNKLTTPNLKNGTYTLSSDNNVVLFEDGIEVGRGTKITFNHNGGELAVVPLGTVTQMQLENGDTVSDWKPAWEDLPNSQKPARLIEGSGTYTYTGSDNLDNYTAIVDVFVPNGGTLNGSPLVNGINKIEGSGVVKIELSGDGLIFTNPQIKDYYAHSYGAKSVTTGTIFNPITKIRMYYDDESAVEYGTDDGSTLEIDSKWATPQTVEYVHSVINGYEYIPVDSKGVYADPATELGDIIIVDNQEALVANTRWAFDGSVTVDIETPLNNEDNYDDPYNNLVQQQFSKKVSLGDSYQGITISREKGFEALMSPDGSEENAIGRYYADLTRGIAFQTRNVPSDPWHDWMYFDTNDKTFKISLYDNAVERIDDTLVDFGLSLEGIEGKIEGVSFGSIGINSTLEDDNYNYWYAPSTNPRLIPFVGLYGKENMSPYTIFEPFEDPSLLSPFGMSFFANGQQENRHFSVVNDYKYGYRIRRFSGNQPFTVEIKEYNGSKTYLRKQTYNFNTVQSHHDISNIEFGNDVEFIGLNYIVSGVSWTNRLQLAETMIGIGSPKPFVGNVDGLKAWTQTQLQMQQAQIDLKVATKDFTGERMVSLISVQPANVKIASKNLDLQGLVTFTNLTDASTIISGDNIKTGKIKSQYLEFDNAVGVNVKLTGEIHATKGSFNNVDISGNLNAGKVGNLNVSSSGITFPDGKLKLDSANNEIAFGTMKMKHRQAPSNVGARDVIEISTSSGKIEFLSGLTYSGGQLPNTLSADAVHTRNIIGQDILAIGGMEGVPEVRISGIPLIIDAFRPRYNEEDIGTASYRYRRIYLRNQPNVSSDNRIKSAIQDIPQDLVSRLMEIKPKMYLQGTEWHFGYIAQDVERALYLWATKRYGKEAKYYVDKFAMLHKSESHLSLLYGELAVLKEQQIMNEIIKLNNRLEILENERH